MSSTTPLYAVPCAFLTLCRKYYPILEQIVCLAPFQHLLLTFFSFFFFTYVSVNKWLPLSFVFYFVYFFSLVFPAAAFTTNNSQPTPFLSYMYILDYNIFFHHVVNDMQSELYKFTAAPYFVIPYVRTNIASTYEQTNVCVSYHRFCRSYIVFCVPLMVMVQW